MRKSRHIFFILICLCFLVGITAALSPRACAAFSMTASESCIEFIKGVEGFSPYPYYDYSQHTVGYGTECPTEKYFDYMVNGIPEDEAEALLYEEIAEIENAINEKLIDGYGLTFTQYQFDALVSFSYNIGPAWMTYDSTLRDAILSDADEDDMVYAFSLYSTAGGNYLPGLVTRRLCEANMYLNGIYSKNVSSDYGYVFYEPNGGSLTYKVQGYVCENHSAPVADAVRNADTFLGWYTDLTGGNKVTALDKSLSGKTLFARWQSSENSESQDSQSTIVRVTGDVVNIRKGPGTNYGISKQVYRNHVLIVSNVTHLTNMTWGKVQDGWICLDYTNYDDIINGTGSTDDENSNDLSDESPAPDRHPDLNDTESDTDIYPDHQEIISGVVRVGDLLRIRSGPGTNYATVGYLFNGQNVEITNRKTVGSMVWGQIKNGWISMDYIVTDDNYYDDTIEDESEYEQEQEPEYELEQEPEYEYEPTEPDTVIEPTEITGIITADVLRIRSGPGTENSIVGFYYQNEIVVISEKTQSGDWGKTNRGWINMNYVSPDSSGDESLPSDEDEMMTVIADCLRIRKDAGIDQKIVAFLYDGDKVRITETKTVDGTVWGKVNQGWISMDYVI